MKTTILFDLDGTLIDSTTAILNGFNHAFKTHGKISPKNEQITELIGYPLDYMFENLGVEISKIQSYIDAYKSKYQKIYLDQTTLLPFVLQGLEFASKFADLGVVTTKTSKFSKILLTHLGVAKFFKVIIGKEDAKNPKPDPEPILNALKILSKNSQTAFMVGDTILDLKAAVAANVTPIAVLCGYGKKQHLQNFTDKIFENSYEAVKFINYKQNFN